MKKLTALYARVSTESRQATGLEAQVRALKAYAKAQGIANFKLFTDEVSGRHARRPGLDKMMAAVERGEITAVVVYSLSRFSRSVTHLLESLDQLNHCKVSFVSLTEALDTSTPTGRAVITIISAISQLERELIVERVKNGLANAKAKGVRLGAPKRHADKLQLIQHLAKQSLSHREIAKLAKCSQSTVSRALRSNESKVPA